MVTLYDNDLPEDEWCDFYSLNPYLNGSSFEKIVERVKTIYSNWLHYDAQGLPITCEHDEAHRRWRRLRSDILQHTKNLNKHEQKYIRKLMNSELPKPNDRTKRPGEYFLRDNGSIKSGDICKVGDIQFLQKSYDFGEIRLSPASYYDDTGHNAAIRDDELSMSFFSNMAMIRKMEYDSDGILKPAGKWDRVTDLVRTRSLSSDYHIWCATADFQPRHIDDFRGNAILVIRDVDTFVSRINDFIQSRYEFATRISSGLVSYYDSFLDKNTDLSLFDAKDQKYWYQQEWRYAMKLDPMNHTIDPNNHIMVNIGCLHDIADLIKI